MAPTQARATQFADLKSKLCALLREQVQDADKEAKDRDHDGSKWRWGPDDYQDGDTDEDVWEDMLLPCSGCDWVGAWRMTSDPGNS